MSIRYRATADGQVPFTDEENTQFETDISLAAADKTTQDALEAITASKLTGIEILGVMCSATGKDQAGMLAVDRLKQKYDAAGAPMPSTKFDFKNGNSLTITNENFASVDAAWTAFRASFFTAP
jgi:hypothetical protein